MADTYFTEKAFSGILGILFMLMGMPAAYAADAQSDARLKIQIGDFLQSSTDSVQSVNGTDYLPLRDLLECYGIKISWAHEADKKIILTTSANQK